MAFTFNKPEAMVVENMICHPWYISLPITTTVAKLRELMRSLFKLFNFITRIIQIFYKYCVSSIFTIGHFRHKKTGEINIRLKAQQIIISP